MSGEIMGREELEKVTTETLFMHTWAHLQPHMGRFDPIQHARNFENGINRYPKTQVSSWLLGIVHMGQMQITPKDLNLE